MKPVLSFDADNNWLGEVRPKDLKAYWENLTETERAFEILEQTEAAVFMAFHDKIMNSIPKPPIQP
nr:MAG TPA: hypothetical protein [Caudoviricetes sp.]